MKVDATVDADVRTATAAKVPKPTAGKLCRLVRVLKQWCVRVIAKATGGKQDGRSSDPVDGRGGGSGGP